MRLEKIDFANGDRGKSNSFLSIVFNTFLHTAHNFVHLHFKTFVYPVFEIKEAVEMKKKCIASTRNLEVKTWCVFDCMHLSLSVQCWILHQYYCIWKHYSCTQTYIACLQDLIIKMPCPFKMTMVLSTFSKPTEMGKSFSC